MKFPNRLLLGLFIFAPKNKKTERKLKIMKKRNFVVSLLTALMMMGIMCTPAFAATESQLSLDTDSVALTKMLLDAEAGSIVVNAYGNSTADVRAKMSEIQAYVDAVSTTSTTPSVKGSIIKTDTGNQVRFRIVTGDVENEFSDKEMETLAAAAGSTCESISNYLCQELAYDKQAAASGKLSSTSNQATAKGALASGKAICMGYSNAFCVLAENAGIRSVKVRGHLKDGGYHVLNMVEVDGELFVLDVTANDSWDRYTLFTMEEYAKATGFSPAIDADEAFALKYAD